MRWTTLFALAALTACDGPGPIAQDPAPSTPLVVGDARAADAPPAHSIADAAVDAEADAADGDACAPGEVWDARVRVRKTWHDPAQMMLPGPLELVVPRAHVHETLYDDCGMTGGGCGDCSRPPTQEGVSCYRTPARVRVEIGVDDVGPT
jgi:hypothetical protein